MDPTHAATCNPLVLAPTYNNAGTLAEVLDGISGQELPMLIVNDGSTDATSGVLDQWLKDHPQVNAKVLTHSRNRGKAAALRTGFARAIAEGYTHVLTIDTDAQHDPHCIHPMLDKSRESPEAYLIGVRDARQPGYPRKSRVGRKVSNLLIRLECGLKVADSQCGLRVYPMELVKTVTCRANRFGYEAEMITRCGWSGCPIIEMPIKTCYLPAGTRVSHFHPWWDSLRAARMHARLLLRAIAPIPHRKYRPGGKDLRKRVTMREMLSWINPLRAWRELREGAIDRTEFATALAVGVFVANLPVYPLQTVIALYLARRLHLNPLAVLAGSQVSTPPLGLLLIVGGIYLGHLILHGNFPSIPDLHATTGSIWHLLGRRLLIDWLVGGPVLGVVTAAGAFLLANRFYRGKEEDEEAAGTDNDRIDLSIKHEIRISKYETNSKP